MFRSMRSMSIFDIALAARGKTKLSEVNFRWVPPEKFNDEWRRNCHCLNCGEECNQCDLRRPVLNCQFCSAAIHKACKKDSFTMTQEDLTTILEIESKFDESIDFVCKECCREIQNSKVSFEAQIHAARNKVVIGRAQTKIAALWRARQSRYRYKSMLSGIMMVQKFVRRMIRRRDLRVFRMSFYRPIKITVNFASNLMSSINSCKCDSFVIVTVLDGNFKQIWRFDTFVVQDTFNPDYTIRGHPEANSHIFGGVTAYSFLVISVFDQDPIQAQFLGQAVIRLQDGDVWKCGGRFNLPLSSRQYSVTNLSANYSANILRGSISIDLKTYVKVDTMCGNLIGPDLDFNFSALTSRSPSVRTTTYWAVLADNLLHIYPHFSNCGPKLILDLTQIERITFYCYSVKVAPKKIRSKQSNSPSKISNASSLLQQDTVKWQSKLRHTQSLTMDEGFDNDDNEQAESHGHPSKRTDFKPHFEIIVPDSGTCYAFKTTFAADIESWRTALSLCCPSLRLVCPEA